MQPLAGPLRLDRIPIAPPVCGAAVPFNRIYPPRDEKTGEGSHCGTAGRIKSLALSRDVNELATLIYNEAERMRGLTGYLALSRNLTISVQLATRVMTELTARDQAAAAAAQVSPSVQPPITN